MHLIWIKFAICAGLIFFAGAKVARYADVIAEKTGLSKVWIGVILVALATSLPELFTGVGSVVFVNAPDLTVGNLIGANSYNLLNIALLDVLYRGGPLLSTVSSGQLLTAGLSLIPICIATLGILFNSSGAAVFSIGNIGIFSIAIFVSYCILAKVIYSYEKKSSKNKADKPADKKYEKISLKTACTYYVIAASVIVASGIWLAYVGDELSGILQLNKSFVGNLFLGFVTTLPEITVSVAALLMGSKEIAVANMLGSNMFNMTIIFVDDVLYRKAPILGAVSPVHVRSAAVVMAMTAIVIIAMATKPKRKFLKMSWYVPALVIIFLVGAYFNYVLGPR